MYVSSVKNEFKWIRYDYQGGFYCLKQCYTPLLYMQCNCNYTQDKDYIFNVQHWEAQTMMVKRGHGFLHTGHGDEARQHCTGGRRECTPILSL